MASSALPVCLCVLLLAAATGFRSDGSDHRICAFANSLQGAEPHPTNELRGVVQENGTIHCGRGSRCYGLWEKRADGEMQLLNQGCWTHVGNRQECHGDYCVLVAATPSQLQKASYRFCCCSRDLCNANFTEAPPTADTPALRPMKADSRDDIQTGPQLTPEKTVLVALVTVAIAAILIVAMFLGYRMMKRKQKYSLSAVDVMEAASSESAVDLDNLKLLELIGRGRYGAVYRGSLRERCVAVKLFSSANRQNYGNERSIYTLLQQHDNIARFLTADERTAADGRPEFLILMELYPHGCLSRYLSLHAVDWLTCCRMTHGVTRGLAFLHTELCRGDQYKPAIAHRDMTSRNVLVRADLSCVLADFGLSMRLTGGRPCRPGDDDTMTISEVGTVRYMSPEVLGGALNLRDCEAALKQVDVYALGLLYWESFRRCSDLFPGEAVPDFQLAFQAELGNHPSFEDMQVLVVREKFRPRFPEVWKENSLVLRSLKETMEDCWDQDAEARLTAQCAEERLAELTLLGTHTAVHNHRNLSHGRWPPQVGSTSSYIEDLQVGVVKNLQGDPYLASVIRTTTGGADGMEKNRNSINYERQQARLSDGSVSTANTLPPAAVLCTISESQHSGGTVLSVPVCLQLTEEDLEATKLHPKEVDKNLREASDENLMEHSQKLFGSELQPSTRLLHQILHGPEVNSSTPRGDPGVLGGGASPPSTSTRPLPKQQNVPQRPSSLHLLPKATEPGPAPRLKPEKLKSNQRQVETGVAKMNTVNVVTAAEPHLVTTVTNNINTKSCAAIVAGSYSAGVPTLVTNAVMGGGRTNPAGPQVTEEDEEKMEGRRLNLLNFSPDEHEPLLRREQPPAESEPLHHHHHHHHHHSRTTNILMGRGSNSNNNNNRLALESKVKLGRIRDLEMGPEGGVSSPKPDPPSSGKPLPLQAPPTTHGKGEGPCFQKETETVLTLVFTDNLKDQVVRSVIPDLRDPSSGSVTAPEAGAQASQVEDTEASSSSSEAQMVDTLTFSQKPLSQEAPDPGPPASDPRPPASDPGALPSNPGPPASDPGALASNPGLPASDLEAPASDPGPPASDRGVPFPEVQAPETPAVEPQDLETTGLAAEVSVLEPADILQGPSLESQTTALLRSQVGQKARRPERPCSLDLSSSRISSDDVSGTDHGSLSASGEKIKRRVKTPYTLKKWRPASWVVSTDSALDPDFEFNTSSSSSHIHFSSSLHRGIGIPKINQSKSSMAVFLVGGGATATTTSEPDGMTCF